MTHPNLMSEWPSIGCQRGCERHHARSVEVDLTRRHGYGDLCAVPPELARSWTMHVWDPDDHPVDGGPYCPAHDAVSETIVSHHVWEPRETVLCASVCASAAPGQRVVDFGAQLGWYSLLAASWGLEVDAYEADLDNYGLLLRSVSDNGWTRLVHGHLTRIGRDTPTLPVRPVRFAKADLEGAEHDAVRVLGPSIAAGMVDHLMLEVSPCFRDDYPGLLATLRDQGFELYRLPPKQRPPHEFVGPEAFLKPYRFDEDTGWQAGIAAEHQLDVWARHRDASW